MATEYLKDKQKLVGIRYMLLAIAGVNVIISVILHIISSFFQDGIPIHLQALITGFAAYVIPIVIYAKTNNITAESAAERFYLRKTKALPIVLAAVMGIGFQFVMVIVNLPVNLLFGNTGSYLPETPLELAAAVFVIGVIPAFFEEFLFRGIIVGSMVEFNTRAAAIFSSVMFAVLHADICGFVGYILMGAILVSVVRRADSVYPAMIFHFANNTTALFLGYFNTELVYAPVFTIILFVIGAVVFAASYTAFTAVTRKPKRVSAMGTGVLLGQSFVSFPVIMCVLLIVLGGILINFI